MARKKETVVDLSDEGIKKSMSNLMTSIDDMCGNFSSWLTDSSTNVEKYDDTGCYMLNALLSGNFKGGFPEGRTSLLAAPSQTGKSFIALKTAALAQKAGKTIIIFDSEGAIDISFAKKMGLDVSRVKRISTPTVEHCKNTLYAILQNIYKNGLNGKIMIILDSLGALSTEMDFNRMERGSDSQDMGSLAKAAKSMLKMANFYCSATQTTMIITNHIYDNPSQMFPSIDKDMPGGRAARYMPSVVCQLSHTKIKVDDQLVKVDDSSTTLGSGFTGIKITGMAVKNRIVKPYIKGDFALSWERGLSKYYGLLDLSKEFGLITVGGAGMYKITIDVPEMDLKAGDSVGRAKELNTYDSHSDFWEKFLPVLQKKIDEEWTYKTHEVEDEYDEDMEVDEED